MDKQIFIINGSGGSGKDLFINLVDKSIRNINPKYNWSYVTNYSSVSKVKDIAKKCGWNGGKTDKDRKFLSDLKLLLTDYNDLPFKCMSYVAEDFYDEYGSKMLFFHIREPDQIKRAVKVFNAKTILVKRDSVQHITSNVSDANVYNYDYDIIIENNGTEEKLEEKAKQFLQDFYNDCFKEKY